MTLSVVQHAGGTGTSNTLTLTLAATGLGNALIIVATVDSNGDSDLQSVTLGGSATGWASQLYVAGTDVEDLSIWANFDIAAGQTSLVVTVPSANGVHALAVDAYEVSGGLTALDKTVHSEVDGHADTWTSTASATTSYASEFILGVVTGFNNAGTALTLTGPGSPWTNETQLTLTTEASSLSGYQIAASEAAFTYSGTANTTGTNLYYLAAVATFRASAATSGPAFHPRNAALQAKRQRLPQQGRIRSNPGGPPSTHTITSYGGISFQPFGFRGYTPSFSFGLLVTTQALLLLDAVLLQQPAGSIDTLSLRLGASPPTATVPMTELPGGAGYTLGGTPCGFNAASGGAAVNSTALSWTNSGGAWEIYGLELWDPAGLGIPVRWLFADWTGYPVMVATGNTFAIPASSLQVEMS